MSLSICTMCSAIVDTDEDCGCYTDHHGNDTPCICYWCREAAESDEEDL